MSDTKILHELEEIVDEKIPAIEEVSLRSFGYKERDAPLLLTIAGVLGIIGSSSLVIVLKRRRA